MLMMYDVQACRKTELYGAIADSFVRSGEQEVIFINRLDQNKLYNLSLKDGSLQKILDESVLSFRLNGDSIIYVSKSDSTEHQIKLE